MGYIRIVRVASSRPNSTVSPDLYWITF